MPEYENGLNISGWVFVTENFNLIPVFHDETISTNEGGMDSSLARPTRNEESQVDGIAKIEANPSCYINYNSIYDDEAADLGAISVDGSRNQEKDPMKKTNKLQN
ncbi:hypothetical protein Fot_52952 [Forsythia ovata]|uniref:Late embryogenesis abundant protein n=1 Tax=Forsythia ovata TaxID=205694 RepID=A0ABD1PHA2_9LAMI